MDFEETAKNFTIQEKMNLLSKIESLKLDVSQSDIKRSGKNTFQHYQYFELKDFMPVVRKLTKKYGLATQFNVIGDRAYLNVFDLESGCFRRWSHELPPYDRTTVNKAGVETAVKGTEMEKSKGALETYARRYLYLAFLELTDGDPIDSGDMSPQQNQNKQKQKNKKYPSPKAVMEQLHEELGDAYTKEKATQLLQKYVEEDITTPGIQKLVLDLINKEGK